MAKLNPIPAGKSMPVDDEGNVVETHEAHYKLPEHVEEEPEDSGEEGEE